MKRYVDGFVLPIPTDPVAPVADAYFVVRALAP